MSWAWPGMSNKSMDFNFLLDFTTYTGERMVRINGHRIDGALTVPLMKWTN